METHPYKAIIPDSFTLRFYVSNADLCFSRSRKLARSSPSSDMDACVCRTGRHWSSTSLATRERRNVHWKQCFACVSPSRRPTQCLVGQAGPQLRNQKYNKVFCNLNHEAPILEARSINDLYDALAERLLPIAARIKDPYFKHIVGLAGPPGAGKSTLSSEVVKRVNKLWSQKLSPIDNEVETPNIAIVLPMDGFHLYNSQLDAMEDPNEAHARRGAPWTFDPARLLTCLNTLRAQGSVYAPSFDHGVGDPVEDDIFLSLQHQIVVVEGNYLLMEDGIWKEISSVFDEKWFVEVDIYNAMQRVLKRHISTGKPPDVAKWRIEYNDRPNAELIMKSKRNADLLEAGYKAEKNMDFLALRVEAIPSLLCLHLIVSTTNEGSHLNLLFCHDEFAA